MSKDATFLLAMPVLKQSIFTRSVILMAEENHKGQLGIILNLPTGTLLKDALGLVGVNLNIYPDMPILFGGPVQTDFFWFIHAEGYQSATTIKLSSKFYLSAALDILPYLEMGQGPEIYYSGVGYSGWTAGQLEKEIEEGDWWLSQMNPEIIFNESFQNQWAVAMKTLGVDPENLVDLTNPLNPTIN